MLAADLSLGGIYLQALLAWLAFEFGPGWHLGLVGIWFGPCWHMIWALVTFICKHCWLGGRHSLSPVGIWLCWYMGLVDVGLYSDWNVRWNVADI